MNITVYESTESPRYLKIRYRPDHQHVEHGLFSIEDESGALHELTEKQLFDVIGNALR